MRLRGTKDFSLPVHLDNLSYTHKARCLPEMSLRSAIGCNRKNIMDKASICCWQGKVPKCNTQTSTKLLRLKLRYYSRFSKKIICGTAYASPEEIFEVWQALYSTVHGKIIISAKTSRLLFKTCFLHNFFFNRLVVLRLLYDVITTSCELRKL